MVMQSAPIRPRPQKRVGGPLFESEAGGVEPMEAISQPRPPTERERLKAQFGFSGRNATPAERDASAFGSNRSRGSFGVEDYRPEPAGPSQAMRDPEPAHMAQLPPEDTSQPSWVDFAGQRAENDMIRARNQGQIVKADEQQARVDEASARDIAAQRQDLELNSLQRRQALIRAFEETTGQPFSEKALAEEMKRTYEAGEKDAILADIFEIFEDEQKDTDAIGPGPEGDRQKALIREHYRELRDRLQNVRTNRAVQLSKQPEPPATEENVLAALQRPGGS